jgi:hypothetical protein
MWHYIEELDGYGNTVAACFIQAPSDFIADISARANRGFIGFFSKTRHRQLPGLTDQIPEQYLDRRLDLDDLRSLDIYCGGDGTGTRPIEERDLPWAL